MACRSAVQESTGCTPALLMLGRELRTPPELAYGRPPNAPEAMAGQEYARQLQDRLETAHRFVRYQAHQAGVRQKRCQDMHAKGQDFQAGVLAWMYGPKRIKGCCPKLNSKWVGPCYVFERVGEVVYKVRLAPRGRRVVLHRDRMALSHHNCTGGENYTAYVICIRKFQTCLATDDRVKHFLATDDCVER